MAKVGHRVLQPPLSLAFKIFENNESDKTNCSTVNQIVLPSAAVTALTLAVTMMPILVYKRHYVLLRSLAREIRAVSRFCCHLSVFLLGKKQNENNLG